MSKILIVDDEEKIVEVIEAYLKKEGYETKTAYNGKEAIEKFRNEDYDLIILDLMLPDINGEDVCSTIRETSDIPIIMLTAKIEDTDRINGFNLGCDDYICKPFNVKELVLRVKAILKRSNTIKSKENIMKFYNNIEINKDSHEVKVRDEYVELTNTEYKILLTLGKNPNKIFTREDLLKCSSVEYFDKIDRVIDAHIKNLRQKIEENTKKPKIIQTVYGVGYKFGIEK